jgi:hypothetical protein
MESHDVLPSIALFREEKSPGWSRQPNGDDVYWVAGVNTGMVLRGGRKRYFFARVSLPYEEPRDKGFSSLKEAKKWVEKIILGWLILNHIDPTTTETMDVLSADKHLT